MTTVRSNVKLKTLHLTADTRGDISYVNSESESCSEGTDEERISKSLEHANVDPEVVRALIELSRATTEDLRCKVGDTIQPVAETYARGLWHALQPAVENARRIAQQVGRAAADTMARTLPPNWDLSTSDIGGTFRRRFDLATQGVVVTWVPRDFVIKALEDADNVSERDAVLVEHSQLIVEDCRHALTEIMSDEESDLARFGLEAVECAATGRWFAAQALAVNVLESAIREHLDKKPAQLRAENYEWSDASTLYWLRLSMTLVAIQPALATFPQRGAVPESINRNATVHCVVPEQYRQANALHGLLLVTSLLREIRAQ